MLLRRVIEHVKAQNWTAVALDFVIVVVGILIAFQITEWSAARAEKAREKAALADLLGEAVEIVRELDRAVIAFEAQNQVRERAVAALATGDASGLSQEEMNFGLSSMHVYPALTLPRDVYDGLVGSGDFSLVTDRGARRAIARYYADLNFFEAQLDYWRMFITARFSGSPPGVRIFYDASANSRMGVEADFDTIAADDAMVAQYVELLRHQLVFQSYRERLFESAKEMCLAIADPAELPCVALGEED